MVALAASATSCQREPTEYSTQFRGSSLSTQAVTRNPFTPDTWGLPKFCPACGTHSPRYLDSETAREAIELSFAKAGCELVRRYPFARDGITFIADGYDPVRHVGYVYLTYDSLNVDAFTTALRGGPGSTEDLELWLGELAIDAQQDNDAALFQEVQAIDRLADREERFRAIGDIVSRDCPTRLSLAEATKLAARAEKTGEFVAVISNFDLRFALPDYYDVADEYREAAMIPDPAKYDAIRKAIHEKHIRQTAESLRATVRDYLAWVNSVR
ncbi:MAG TPA: hypothetical protein VFW87_16265 [Pirellulales bacterium]|nr:hypothetical protein [Pirellulales bacterium]